MNADLCDAVTGNDDGRGDSRAMLDHLLGLNLFVIPLDDERRWFRYHQLVITSYSIHYTKLYESILFCSMSRSFSASSSPFRVVSSATFSARERFPRSMAIR